MIFSKTVEATKLFGDEMDKMDPFKRFRNEFYFPLNCQAYLTGFGLGLLSKNSEKYINIGLNEWKKYGSNMYAESKTPLQICEKNCEALMVDIIGAHDTNEVCIMNACSVNANLLLMSFYKPNISRNKILMEYGAFCSDYHIIHGICDINELKYKDILIEVKPGNDGYIISDDSIISTIKQHSNELSIVWLGFPNYLTGQVFDIERIVKTAHEYNILVGLDISHGIGNCVLKLHEWNVDFACWCSYKYLNASGGGIGGIFVHERHHKRNDIKKLRGWWGQTRQWRYKFDRKHIPINNAQSWSISQTPLLLCLCLEGSLQYFKNAGGIQNLRYKSECLIKYMDILLQTDKYLQKHITIITPKALNKRANGYMLIFNHTNMDLLGKYLRNNGVFVFIKSPNIIRFCIHPLYSSFNDCYYFANTLSKFYENGTNKHNSKL